MSVEVYDQDYALAEHKPTVSDMFTGNSGDMFSTVNVRKLEDRIKLAATVDEAESLDDVIPCEFVLNDIFEYPTEVKNIETNTMDSVVMINLMTDQGVYRTASNGVRNSLERFISILGDFSEWKGKVKFKAHSVKTRSGYKTTILSIVK